jgi:inhibitor of the pro-sigma K processing machinery
MSAAAIVVALAVAGLILFGVTRLFLVPIRLLLGLVLNGVLGLGLLYLANLAGRFVGLHIGVNPITVLLAGLLRVPGVILLVAMRVIYAA